MRSRSCFIGLVLLALAGTLCVADAAPAQTADATRVEDALQNITTLVRRGRVGYATVWDGNKYVQCRHLTDHAMRCEAAGIRLQPSLRAALTGDRIKRLAELGWELDPSFGNYARRFPADMPAAIIADAILRTLREAYDAATIEVETTWVVDLPCPPRNGPSQNLAGLINDAPSMRPTALLACSYLKAPDAATSAASADQLLSIYSSRMTAEIQRLRINAARPVYAVFSAGIGYVQCRPDGQEPVIYCEAQSAESWPALASILTPQRVELLHKAGYSSPGRAPNYWKNYRTDEYDDTALATEILTLLFDVYGYRGSPKLKISTENE